MCTTGNQNRVSLFVLTYGRKQEELLVEVARWVTTVNHVAVCELEDN